jgi:hemerythrin superfamily protein
MHVAATPGRAPGAGGSAQPNAGRNRPRSQQNGESGENGQSGQSAGDGDNAASSDARQDRAQGRGGQARGGKAQGQSQKPEGKSAKAKDPAMAGPDAVALLTADHRKVERLFDDFEKAQNASQKSEIALQICKELIVHAQIEEEIFYPALRDAAHTQPKVDTKVDEAQVEHDSAKLLIQEILAGSPNEPFFDAKVKVLAEQIRHHVREEEQEKDGLFAKAKSAGVNQKELGERLVRRKQELMETMAEGEPEPPQPTSFNAQPAPSHGRIPRRRAPPRPQRPGTRP